MVNSDSLFIKPFIDYFFLFFFVPLEYSSMFVDKAACFPADGSAEATEAQMRNYTNVGLLRFWGKEMHKTYAEYLLP